MNSPAIGADAGLCVSLTHRFQPLQPGFLIYPVQRDRKPKVRAVQVILRHRLSLTYLSHAQCLGPTQVHSGTPIQQTWQMEPK